MDALQQLNIAAPVADIFGKLEYDIIVAIARQLSKNPDKLINHTSEWRIQMLARMGKVSKETARYIAQQTKDVPGDVEAIINEVVTAVLDEHGLAGNDKVIENLSKALEMFDHQAVKDKYNQVNTVMQYKARKAYVDGVNGVADRFEKGQIANKQEHLDILNKNALEVTLGEKTRTEAVRDTIREMADRGIPAFVDASGREWSPEAYVSMDIRNTAKNAALMSEFEATKELGQDVILVSSHAAARPLCAPYQGKFYSLSGKAGTITDAYGKEYTYEPLSSTSYGEPAGLFGINCGHTFRGVEDGLFVNNEETYSEKENSEEYEKVQKQRRMEREIRKNKMKRDALRAAGDEEGAREYDLKVRQGNKRLNEYCAENGLAVRQDRTKVYGYSDPNLKQKPKDIVKTVDKTEKSGIMETERSIKLKSFDEATDYAKKHLSVSISGLKDMPIDNISAVGNCLHRMYKENPSLSGFIDEVVLADMNDIAKSSILWKDDGPVIRLKLSRDCFVGMSVSQIESTINDAVEANIFSPKDGLYGIFKHESAHLAEFKATFKKYSSDYQAIQKSLDNFEEAAAIKSLAFRNCNLDETDVNVGRFVGRYAKENAAEFVAECYSSTNGNLLVDEVKRLIKKKWGV